MASLAHESLTQRIQPEMAVWNSGGPSGSIWQMVGSRGLEIRREIWGSAISQIAAEEAKPRRSEAEHRATQSPGVQGSLVR